MAYTSIADMQLIPNKFADYVLHRTTEKSMLVRSGITVSDPVVARLINGAPRGSRFIEMPYVDPLAGEETTFNEQELAVSGITTGKGYATLMIRQKAWGDNDLAHVAGGLDPMAAVGNLIADWWTVREQAAMLSVLKGILDPTAGALKAHILDVTGDATDPYISVDTALDTKNLMGDAYDKLGVCFMHSATYTYLQKKQQIDTVYDSDLKINIQYYLGYQVIVDDGMPVEGDAGSRAYTTYFLGKGCIARQDGTPEGLVTVERGRHELKAQNFLINRRAMVLHPLGLSWNVGASLTDLYPNNTELANPANWTVVEDLKNIPICALKHKINEARTAG